MANYRHSRLVQEGSALLCVARGTVEWERFYNAAGVLQLWYDQRNNGYFIKSSNIADFRTVVCKVIDVLTLHFQKCTDKIKTLLTTKSKFHFVQY